MELWGDGIMFKPNWDCIQGDADFHDLLDELFLAELNFTNCQLGEG